MLLNAQHKGLQRNSRAAAAAGVPLSKIKRNARAVNLLLSDAITQPSRASSALSIIIDVPIACFGFGRVRPCAL